MVCYTGLFSGSADLFSLLVAFGVTCLFAGQALFNISVVTGMVPNKDLVASH